MTLRWITAVVTLLLVAAIFPPFIPVFGPLSLDDSLPLIAVLTALGLMPLMRTPLRLDATVIGFGLVALFQRHAGSSRMLGLIGFLLAVTSLIGISGLNFFEALINPVLAVESTDFVHTYGAGTGIGYVAILFPILGVLFLLGYVFFCWDMLAAGTAGRKGLWLTMIGTIIFAAGLSGFLPMMVVKVGSVLFGAGLIVLGISTQQRQFGSELA